MCGGRLVPGKRYAFRASKSRQRGSLLDSRLRRAVGQVQRTARSPTATTGRATSQTGTPSPTIAFEMVKGRPTRAGSGLARSYHSVPKWKWWLMDVGYDGFKVASD